MNINVDPEKLYFFANYVSDFSKNINTACRDINSATNKVAQSMDEEDMADIRRLTKEITQILDAGGPTLSNLEKCVESYARLVERLKAVAKG